MQFLPSTWRRYGVDASGTGVRDPYNAADAVFSAARYLAAAGAARNLPAAIFAYNHSWAYVKSVLVRAGFFAGEPTALVQSVTELAAGDFPIQLSYDASYGGTPSGGGDGTAADVAHTAVATRPARPVRRPRRAVGAAPRRRPRPAPRRRRSSPTPHAAVVAVQDGTVVAIGYNRKLGHYVRLRNGFGDTFTYGNLASVSGWYPDAEGTRRLAGASSTRRRPGSHRGRARTGRRPPRAASPRPAPRRASCSPEPPRRVGRAHVAPACAAASATPLVVTLNLASSFTARSVFTPISVLDQATTPAAPPAVLAPITGTTERAGPPRVPPVPRSPQRRRRRRARSGRASRRATRRRPSLMAYFTGAFGIGPSQLELAPRRVGAHVLAGTILGRLAELAAARTSSSSSSPPVADARSTRGRSSTPGRSSARSSCTATAYSAPLLRP